VVNAVPKKIRKKKESCRSLEKKLDGLWSQYTRLSNMDEEGRIPCYTCPAILDYRHAQCGHYMVRTHKATRFHVINTKPQCFNCNMVEQGKQVAFRAHIVADYNEATAQEIERLAYTECHRKPEWYHAEIDRVSQVVEKLLKKHGIN
jgi:Bacteriophage Lambda NinG protein